MRLGPILSIALLALPLLELYVLLQVGGMIGAGWTIFAVVFTAILGIALVRHQGFTTVRRIRAQIDRGGVPAMALLEGFFLLVAGFLLLFPGFLTDILGFACLIPPLRRAVIRLLVRRGAIVRFRSAPGGPRRPGSAGGRPGEPLEGQYRRMDD